MRCMRSSISESAVSAIQTKFAQLPPPKPEDRLLQIDEAAARLYDDLRIAILGGHSIAGLAENIFAPAGWNASPERIRRAVLAIARKRKDKELGDKIGGLRPRRHRAVREGSASTARRSGSPKSRSGERGFVPMPPKPVERTLPLTLD